MKNRFLYSVIRDRELKGKIMLLLIVLPFCLVLWSLDRLQRSAFKEVLARQAAARITAFKAPVVAKVPVDSDHISGIIIEDTRSFAVINDRMLKVGDAVGSKTIVKIAAREVTLCEKAELSECVHLWLEK